MPGDSHQYDSKNTRAYLPVVKPFLPVLKPFPIDEDDKVSTTVLDLATGAKTTFIEKIDSLLTDKAIKKKTKKQLEQLHNENQNKLINLLLFNLLKKYCREQVSQLKEKKINPTFDDVLYADHLVINAFEFADGCITIKFNVGDFEEEKCELISWAKFYKHLDYCVRLEDNSNGIGILEHDDRLEQQAKTSNSNFIKKEKFWLSVVDDEYLRFLRNYNKDKKNSSTHKAKHKLKNSRDMIRAFSRKTDDEKRIKYLNDKLRGKNGESKIYERYYLFGFIPWGARSRLYLWAVHTHFELSFEQCGCYADKLACLSNAFNGKNGFKKLTQDNPGFVDAFMKQVELEYGHQVYYTLDNKIDSILKCIAGKNGFPKIKNNSKIREPEANVYKEVYTTHKVLLATIDFLSTPDQGHSKKDIIKALLRNNTVKEIKGYEDLNKDLKSELNKYESPENVYDENPVVPENRDEIKKSNQKLVVNNDVQDERSGSDNSFQDLKVIPTKSTYPKKKKRKKERGKNASIENVSPEEDRLTPEQRFSVHLNNYTDTLDKARSDLPLKSSYSKTISNYREKLKLLIDNPPESRSTNNIATWVQNYETIINDLNDTKQKITTLFDNIKKYREIIDLNTTKASIDYKKLKQSIPEAYDQEYNTYQQEVGAFKSKINTLEENLEKNLKTLKDEEDKYDKYDKIYQAERSIVECETFIDKDEEDYIEALEATFNKQQSYISKFDTLLPEFLSTPHNPDETIDRETIKSSPKPTIEQLAGEIAVLMNRNLLPNNKLGKNDHDNLTDWEKLADFFHNPAMGSHDVTRDVITESIYKDEIEEKKKDNIIKGEYLTFLYHSHPTLIQLLIVLTRLNNEIITPYKTIEKSLSEEKDEKALNQFIAHINNLSSKLENTSLGINNDYYHSISRDQAHLLEILNRILQLIPNMAFNEGSELTGYQQLQKELGVIEKIYEDYMAYIVNSSNAENGILNFNAQYIANLKPNNPKKQVKYLQDKRKYYILTDKETNQREYKTLRQLVNEYLNDIPSIDIDALNIQQSFKDMTTKDLLQHLIGLTKLEFDPKSDINTQFETNTRLQHIRSLWLEIQDRAHSKPDQHRYAVAFVKQRIQQLHEYFNSEAFTNSKYHHDAYYSLLLLLTLLPESDIKDVSSQFSSALKRYHDKFNKQTLTEDDIKTFVLQRKTIDFISKVSPVTINIQDEACEDLSQSSYSKSIAPSHENESSESLKLQDTIESFIGYIKGILSSDEVQNNFLQYPKSANENLYLRKITRLKEIIDGYHINKTIDELEKINDGLKEPEKKLIEEYNLFQSALQYYKQTLINALREELSKPSEELSKPSNDNNGLNNHNIMLILLNIAEPNELNKGDIYQIFAEYKQHYNEPNDQSEANDSIITDDDFTRICEERNITIEPGLFESMAIPLAKASQTFTNDFGSFVVSPFQWFTSSTTNDEPLSNAKQPLRSQSVMVPDKQSGDGNVNNDSDHVSNFRERTASCSK